MKSYSFLSEGPMADFAKRVASIRSEKGIGSVNRALDKILMTGSGGDPVKMGAKRLNYLRKNDPQLAHKMFSYFNKGRDSVNPEDIKTIQQTTANLGVKNGIVGDVAKKTANDAAYGAGVGAKVGKNVGGVTGVIGPAVGIAGAINAPYIAQHLTPDAIQAAARNSAEWGVNAGTNVGNYLANHIPVVGPKTQQFINNNPITSAAITGAVPSSMLALIYRFGQANKYLGKQAGKAIGAPVGGIVGGAKSLASKTRSTYIDPRSVDLDLASQLETGYKYGTRQAIDSAKNSFKKAGRQIKKKISNSNPFNKEN